MLINFLYGQVIIFAILTVVSYVIVVKTTMYIEDSLIKKVKAEAVEEGVSLTVFTENALRESLARRKKAKHTVTKLPVFHGDGTLPGVDISDNAALIELMENQ